ncbi:MAG: flagellar basal body P-ring protein FlgI [Fimbriimonadaceae bacterium]
MDRKPQSRPNLRRIAVALSAAAFGLVAASAAAQVAPTEPAAPAAPMPTPEQIREIERMEQNRRESIIRSESRGVEVRIKDMARFRGVRGNQLLGYGLVFGLEGTGDTRSTPFTQTLLANAMKFEGTIVDPNALKVRNVAVVSITAELPPFAAPGNRIDVTVQSIGDAKSLQGGYLIQSPLYAAGNREVVYAVAQGAISIGGFNASGGGSSVQKNHATVGRIPGGAFVERSVPTQIVFDGKLYLELDEADMTTASRVAATLGERFPEYRVRALNAGSIEVALGSEVSPIDAMSRIEQTHVFVDVPAVVVINERTGTIVVGGNVRLGPALVAKGSLTIRIEKELRVSQPEPFSRGSTVIVPNTTVSADETEAQVMLMPPTTTVADLARIFQALRVSPTDIIAILQGLRDQGALQARIRIQ